MDVFTPLPNIVKLGKTVTRVMGQNPGKFTLQGTNTYLVGERNPYILIDTGEGRDEYIPILEEALLDPANEHDAAQPHVSDIILTHRHHDHTHGLPSVLALLRKLWDPAHASPFVPPRLHKIPLPVSDTGLSNLLDSLEPASYTAPPSGEVVHDLADGDTLRVTTATSTGSEHALHVVHTPGHTPDSLCLLYPAARALFTADTVLGHGSCVFEELGPYMASLAKLVALGKGDGAETAYGAVYPGHGEAVEDGLRHVAMYLQHRVERENQIVAVLRRAPPAPAEGEEAAWSTWSIVTDIYARYPRNLWEPAAHNTELHLRKLEQEGRAECLGGAGFKTRWHLIS